VQYIDLIKQGTTIYGNDVKGLNIFTANKAIRREKQRTEVGSKYLSLKKVFLSIVLDFYSKTDYFSNNQ